MKKKYYHNYPNERDEDEYGFPVSAYDMTGLIPSEPQSEDDLDAYEDIYPYLADEEDFRL